MTASNSHGLWEATAPSFDTQGTLKGAHAFDVAIVGAGYTGLSAALHLAEKGFKVAVLEARHVGFGGAGRNVGLVNAGLWVMPEALLAQLGPVYGERILRLLGDGPAEVFARVQKHSIDCQATPNGTLHLANDEKGLAELKQREEQWQARQAPVRLLSREDTAKRVGSNAFLGGLLDSRAGTIQPLAYVRGLAKAAIAAGVSLFENSPVIAHESSDSADRLLTASGEVRAPKIIIATDAYSEGPFTALRREQVFLPYFNFATKPMSAEQAKSVLPNREGCWDTNEVLSSFRLDKDNRLVLGSVGALRNTGRHVHKDWAERALNRFFPQLKGIGFEQSWFGQIGMTDDNVPRFHKLTPHAVCINGYNGRGISPGTVMGRILAEYVAGERPESEMPLPLSPIHDAAWRLPKESLYEYGAQAVHLIEYR